MREYFIKNITNKNNLNQIILELDNLVDFYLNFQNKKTKSLSSIKKNLHKKMVTLAKKDRKLFGKFFDAAQCIPSLHSLNSNLLKDIKKIFNFKLIQIGDYPRLRLDLPDNRNNDPWHQEAMNYDAPRDSITLWLPLVKMYKSLGRLEIKRDSRKIGLLKYSTHKTRPYFRVCKKSLNKLPSWKPYVPFGKFIVFNHAVPHRSTRNVSRKFVRISIQIRYNFLDNKVYNNANYIPTTPRLVSRQEVSNFESKRSFKI